MDYWVLILPTNRHKTLKTPEHSTSTSIALRLTTNPYNYHSTTYARLLLTSSSTSLTMKDIRSIPMCKKIIHTTSSSDTSTPSEQTLCQNNQTYTSGSTYRQAFTDSFLITPSFSTIIKAKCLHSIPGNTIRTFNTSKYSSLRHPIHLPQKNTFITDKKQFDQHQ